MLNNDFRRILVFSSEANQSNFFGEVFLVATEFRLVLFVERMIETRDKISVTPEISLRIDTFNFDFLQLSSALKSIKKASTDAESSSDLNLELGTQKQNWRCQGYLIIFFIERQLFPLPISAKQCTWVIRLLFEVLFLYLGWGIAEGFGFLLWYLMVQPYHCSTTISMIWNYFNYYLFLMQKKLAAN